ncbi:Protein of unknown function [Jatrophihabitans endophyticus]|uniref:DUF3618 domain-containing protein n=1 Tax=Jatrophihabitans endophyticus TaxID=1206085 RepID=A0A1M5E216_9ACTN|nr:DUF3618 domain-containing protein [Jatrophihabitans endophyticus]SHF73216.1 Protein of unknown function [Jatrophihabitans endophyticus]
MSSNPDQLEADVDRSRDSLGRDVARLNDRVSPARFVGTRTDRVKQGAASIKDKLMGSSNSAGDAAKDRLGSAVGSVKDATDNAAGRLGDATGSAPETLRQQTQGNPVAAGLIAFGVGWLLSSLVPASQAEQQAAAKLEENADAVVEPLTESAKEVAGNLQQPLQDSAAALKDTATDAVDRTTEHAKSAAGDVKDQAADAKDDVAGGSGDSTRATRSY